MIGVGATGAAATAGAKTAAAGISAKAAGFYTLTHAETGMTMLGSTAGEGSQRQSIFPNLQLLEIIKSWSIHQVIAKLQFLNISK